MINQPKVFTSDKHIFKVPVFCKLENNQKVTLNAKMAMPDSPCKRNSSFYRFKSINSVKLIVQLTFVENPQFQNSKH